MSLLMRHLWVWIVDCCANELWWANMLWWYAMSHLYVCLMVPCAILHISGPKWQQSVNINSSPPSSASHYMQSSGRLSSPFQAAHWWFLSLLTCRDVTSQSTDYTKVKLERTLSTWARTKPAKLPISGLHFLHSSKCSSLWENSF